MEKIRSARGRAITLQDVAHRAGVAASTASYVLNNKPKSIGDATRQRILTAAQEIGYRPNMAARSLVTQQTNIIALWMPNVATAFSAGVIAEIQNQARRHGYEVLICDTEVAERNGGAATTGSRVAATTLKMPLWNVDGIIAFFGSASHAMNPAALSAPQIPTVSMGAFPIAGTDFVGLDLFSAAQDAARWLLASRCRRIGFLVPASENIAADERHKAYMSVMQEAGREPIIISAHQNSRRAAYEAMTRFLQQHEPLDGLFCYNDYAATGACRALREAGLAKPGAVLLVGCDGIEDIEYLGWPLSTIVLPVPQMCATAWQFLQERLQEPARPPQQVVLAGYLDRRI